nr:aminopeptidase [Acidobacteriota bacterium]
MIVWRVAALAVFEMRYQSRNPLYRGAIATLFLLAFAAAASPTLRLGAPGQTYINAPRAIAQTELIFGLIYMMVAAALVAGAAARDHESGFAPILFSLPVREAQYEAGRLLGALAACSAGFLVVPAGIFASTVSPWVDPQTLGVNHASHYLFAFAFLCLPVLVSVSAIVFALANITRSMLGGYLALLALLILHVAAASGAARPELREAAALFDPFGLATFRNVVRYWTVAQNNSAMPALQGPVLWGRLLWLAIAAMLMLLSVRFKGNAVKRALPNVRQDALASSFAAGGMQRLLPRGRALHPKALTQLAERTRLELKLVLQGPAFLVLLLLGIAHAAAALAFGGDLYGTPTLPLTRDVIPTLIANFAIVPAIVAIYYGGEVVWRERDRRIHEIVGTAPIPSWALVAPKMLALGLVLVTMTILS